MEPATDLDDLIGRGFSEEEAKQALHETRGDIYAALKMLQSGSVDTSWVSETPGEWRDRVMSPTLPLYSEARAIQKSSFYVSIPSWSRKQVSKNEEKVFYRLNVILRDGRKWSIEKRYSALYELRWSFPMGSLNHLKHSFPVKVILSLNPSNEQYEQRRLSLDQWIREVCLDEKCMSDAYIIGLLENFLEVDKHELADNALFPIINYAEWTIIPSHELTSFPLTLTSLASNLPCKVNLSTAFDTPQSWCPGALGDEVTIDQVEKDLLRDRIVVQGCRLEGSEVGLNGVFSSCMSAAERVLAENSTTWRNEFPRASLQELIMTALKLVGRTESAYASYSVIHHVVDQEAEPGIMLIPESTLAHPMLLVFRLEDPSSRGKSQTQLLGQKCMSDSSYRKRTESSPLLTTPVTSYPSSEPDRCPPSVSAKDELSFPVRKRRTQAEPPGHRVVTSLSQVTSVKPAFFVSTPSVPRSLVCDLQATSVYRFADIESMQAMLQVKATYCKSIKLPPRSRATSTPVRVSPSKVQNAASTNDLPPPPVISANDTPSSGNNLRSQFIYSRSYIVINRETKTSTRDWL